MKDFSKFFTEQIRTSTLEEYNNETGVKSREPVIFHDHRIFRRFIII
jgi:hypothetical protein